ncbi:MAG: tetratricopeptide repeat protein, partial [Saprospiraceae bacterium]
MYIQFILIGLIVFCDSELKAQNSDSLIINRKVDSLMQVVQDYLDIFDFQKALEINSAAETIALQKFGHYSYLYGKTSFNRGRIYDHKSEFTNAVKWYLESLSIFEETKIKPTFDIIKNLNKLGNIYRILGQFEIAESCLLESLNLQESQIEANPIEFAFCLNNLGIIYFSLSQYENAELYYHRSLSIKEKSVGKRHPDFAVSLNCLANLYSTLENYQKANLLYLQAKEIYDINQNTKSAEYALLLNNLGINNLQQNNFELSEKYYLKAISIQHELLGNEHPEYATSINNLAALYFKIGKLPQADSLFLEASSIWLKTLGEAHPEYLASQNNLAAIYFAISNFEKAKAILKKTNAICKKLLGEKHPDYILNLINLVSIYWLTKDFDTIKSYLSEVMSAEKTILYQASNYLTEFELSKFIQNFSEKQNIAFSINQESLNLNEICFDNALFFKGFILNASVQLNRLIKLDTKNYEKLQFWKHCNQNLATLYATKVVDRDSQNFVSLIEIANTLEKELIQTVKDFKKTNMQVYWKDVQNKLTNKEAAIEFVSYSLSNSEFNTDSIMYAALLLKPDESQPIFISLFEEKSLDSLLQLNAERKTDYVNNLYSIAGRGAVALETPKRTLYEMIWEPIEKYMEGIKTIYFSPSGLLHRINLDAIPVSESETLADKYKLIELNSTRQLVIPDQVEIMNNDAVLYGGIQFEADTTFHKNEPVIASRSRGELSFSSVDSSLRGGSWNYLPGSAREINSIESILKKSKVKITLKTGYGATEESFKNLGANNTFSPRILHIATHGYFFEDLIKSSQKSEINSQNENVFTMSDHPMLRSGLIMAGGNATWQGKQTLEGREDGILTAYEISQMNLSNTELVVLSACETGLGEIQGNEGVYGLQRAFKIAGAKYLIMSLWQVPDKQT